MVRLGQNFLADSNLLGVIGPLLDQGEGLQDGVVQVRRDVRRLA